MIKTYIDNKAKFKKQAEENEKREIKSLSFRPQILPKSNEIYKQASSYGQPNLVWVKGMRNSSTDKSAERNLAKSLLETTPKPDRKFMQLYDES
jgi:L-2-hydroxyglutarate oxidase LhgO